MIKFSFKSKISKINVKIGVKVPKKAAFAILVKSSAIKNKAKWIPKKSPTLLI